MTGKHECQWIGDFSSSNNISEEKLEIFGKWLASHSHKNQNKSIEQKSNKAEEMSAMAIE